MSFWSRSLAILLAATQANLDKRQTKVPSICDAECKNAAFAALGTGKVPALCAPGSNFEIDLALCTACIEDEQTADVGTTTNANASSVDALTSLQPYVIYCNQDSDAAILSSAVAVAQSLSSASVSVASQSLVLCLSLASESLTPSASCFPTTSSTLTSTLQSARATSVTALPTATNVIVLTKNGTGTIIGAAVGGSIGSILLIALLVGFIIIRRRKQRSRKELAAAQLHAKEKPPEKAQLHSDDYKPPREELLGTLGKKQYDPTVMAELPSNESVEQTKEMPANEVVGAELDNRVKVPNVKTDVSSQSTKVGSGSIQ